MRQDDSDEPSRRRADIEAQVRALEEKREKLQEQLAARRPGPVNQAEGVTRAVALSAVLLTLEKVLMAVQPTLDMAASARDDLTADRAEALRDNDAASANEATKLLDEVEALRVELTGTVAQLSALAESVRASMYSDAASAAKEPEAG